MAIHEPDSALCAAISTLQAWAKTTPEVVNVWIFGSRVRGAHRPDSDVDVAVEHDAGEDFGGRQDEWRKLLRPQIGLPLDLWVYDPKKDPGIRGAVGESSIHIYGRPESKA